MRTPAPPSCARGASRLFSYGWTNEQMPGYAVYRGARIGINIQALFVYEDAARDYCDHRNRLVDVRGDDSLEGTNAPTPNARPAQPVGTEPDRNGRNADVERNAARYRWLRSQHDSPHSEWNVRRVNEFVIPAGQLDAAIDAAIQGDGAGE